MDVQHDIDIFVNLQEHLTSHEQLFSSLRYNFETAKIK